MLRQSSIEVKDSEGKVKTVEVGEALDAFNKFNKLGGREALYMHTYSPLTRTFSYQLPTNVQPARGVSKVLNIDIKVGDGICTVKVGSIVKVLVMNNNLVTSMSVEALKNLHAVPIKIGWLSVDEKGKRFVDFKPILKVYDFTFAPKKEVVAIPVPVVPVEVPKKIIKRGRPKKVTIDVNKVIEAMKVEVKADKPEEYVLIKLDTKDGSLFVCDNIIMK